MIIEEQPRTGVRRVLPRLADVAEDWSRGLSRTFGERDLDRGANAASARLATFEHVRAMSNFQRRLRPEGELARQLRADVDVGVADCPIPNSDDWQLLEELHGTDRPNFMQLLELRTPGLSLRPQPHSLLRPGQRFEGHQCVNRANSAATGDWRVTVRIEECNWSTGYICGSMTAENVPHTSSPVSTFFEGNIVGAGKHTFRTCDWDADRMSDVSHWSKFPAFNRLQAQAAAADPQSPMQASADIVFMRWKEKAFETKYGEQCGLTIAGFYYLAFSCEDRTIEGYYYDPNSQPFQKLRLRAVPAGHHGYTSSAYQFC